MTGTEERYGKFEMTWYGEHGPPNRQELAQALRKAADDLEEGRHCGAALFGGFWDALHPE